MMAIAPSWQAKEHFLWHGTTRKAAEAIVRADFRVPKDWKGPRKRLEGSDAEFQVVAAAGTACLRR